MPETTSEVTATAGEPNEQGKDAAKEFTAITSQEDFDKAIQARIARERAKIPADYAELQAKAAKLSEIEDAKKSDEQKAAERVAAAEQRAVALEAQVARAEVAAEKGVPVGLLVGGTKEELEASADALIEFRTAGQSRTVPNTWDRPSKGTSVADQFADWSESTFS